jgi:hypothetical protein
MSEAVRLIFAGDILFRSPVEGYFVETSLREILRKYEILSCNFEAPVCEHQAVPIAKAGPHERQLVDASNYVKEAGFNLINLANNHIYDFGDNALETTLLAFNGCLTIGAGMNFDAAYELKVLTVNNIKIGFLGFCEAEFGFLANSQSRRGGYAWVNHPSVNKIVQAGKEKVDFLIIQIHAGPEEVDIPIPEWRSRYRELIQLGADAVIGHHPHVPQGWEEFKNCPIFYSLGNFYFESDSKHPYWNKGYLASLSLKLNHPIEYHVIPIERKGTKVGICQDEEFRYHLDKLCHLLDSSEYITYANKQALLLWNERYKKYYINALNGTYPNNFFRAFLRACLMPLKPKRQMERHLLLLHNIRIESHRWTTERALTYITEDEAI